MANSFVVAAGAPPDPYVSPRAWDTCIVAGQTSPGLMCVVNGFKRKHAWDEKRGKGAPFENLTFTGAHLARGTIDFYLLYGPDPNGNPYTHLADWATFSKLFKYDPTKQAANAVTIYHPALAMIDVKSVICEDVGSPERVQTGVMKATVSLTEWAKVLPVASVSSPTGAVTNPAPGAPKPPGTTPDPVSEALQKRIAAELAIAQAPLPGSK